MDCRNCIYIRYGGCSHCSHPGHSGMSIVSCAGRRKEYDRRICPDFTLRKRCSNCKYWKRGEYFMDGKTPSRKGYCSLGLSAGAGKCQIWGRGKTTCRSRHDKCAGKIQDIV